MYFSHEDKMQLIAAYRLFLAHSARIVSKNDRKIIRMLVEKVAEKKAFVRPLTPIHPIVKNIHTAILAEQEIGLGNSTIVSILIYDAVILNVITLEELSKHFDASVVTIIRGLIRANELYEKNTVVETENFRKLLLTFAEDIRVVFILIAERVYTMRNLSLYDTESQLKISREASYLYAPLAHRMGLYRLKTELEDLSLRYTSPDIYFDIARKLNETKASRDKYMDDFIAPLKKQLKEAGFDFDMKGRTKSIHSIWNKIKKQNTAFERIYDLFAIRIILNSPPEKEKADCWQVYSIVTDKYQPNPKRLRDWLSIPKTNGYESLHTTVMGPDGKWVEVQIRTRRMDEIAEKGLAAHWKYKGGKSEKGVDDMLKNIRDILENPDLKDMDYMDDFKLDLYGDEVFVFTPKGDLFKLKNGATVLDFAFNIHSELGSKCVGAKVNGKNVPIRHVLNNGDQVEVLSNVGQKPNRDWLKIVVTSKARTKVKQVLKEIDYKDAEAGKEMLQRRFKNWKLDVLDADITRLAKKLGYKAVSDFYQDIAQEKLDLFEVRSHLTETAAEEVDTKSAGNFVQALEGNIQSNDVLVIDQNLKNVQYKLSKCCNPIYGDAIFGFVSVYGGIKIHRTDCPNAPQLIERFGYRIVPARWSGKSGSQYAITIRVIGKDDIGIVTNITSLISKESNVTLRSISVDSVDGLFQGIITLLVSELNDLEGVLKKIKTVKGVKQVERLNN
jgi:GTP pyrophosphokinase